MRVLYFGCVIVPPCGGLLYFAVVAMLPSVNYFTMCTHTLNVAYPIRLVTYCSRDTADKVESLDQDNSAFIREAIRQKLHREGFSEE